jgi:uncharacterized protein YdeI (YjbR/CyaY-like superfamily)
LINLNAILNAMIKTDNFAKVEVTSVAQLRQWLELHHTQTESIWLVTYKKHVRDQYVSVDEILDEVLCFGWIDGIRRKLDADRTMQLLGPRRVQHWSSSYKERVARLEQAQRMHPAGLQAIAESKQQGLWDYLDDVDALVIPADLIDAFKVHPGGIEAFEVYAPSYKRNVLRWLKLAKTPITRTKRITTVVHSTVQNEKIPHMPCNPYLFATQPTVLGLKLRFIRQRFDQ